MLFPDRLYKVCSLVDNHPDLGNVCFSWFYHLRKRPVAPYEDLVWGYAELDDARQARAQSDVDRLFTKDEVEILGAYLEKKHGFECFLIERFVPVRLEDMDDNAALRLENYTPGSIYMFSQEPGYSLPFEVWAYYHLLKSEKADESGWPYPIERWEEKVEWLARQIFTAFPKVVTGLKFYILDCGCIYYQRKLFDGTLISKAGTYRDARDGPCRICMTMDNSWQGRIIDETLVYNCGFIIY